MARRPVATGKPASRRKARAAAPPHADPEIHRLTRRAHLTETAEDYCETIADLIDRTGEARGIDVARRLGVTHVTVAKTVARLARDGLVTTRPYRAIFLTPLGRKLAADAARRHQIVVRFLRALGVSDRAAHADAEGIEHHVGPETLAAMERFRKLRRRSTP